MAQENSKNRKDLGTAILGVALIVVGIIALSVQLFPAFAGTASSAWEDDDNTEVCDGSYAPRIAPKAFDAYDDLLPSLVELRHDHDNLRSVVKVSQTLRNEVRVSVRLNTQEARHASREAIREILSVVRHIR